MSAPTWPEAHPEFPLPPEFYPCVDHLVTENDTPVDNIFSEKQMRLLTHPLFSSWQPPGNQPYVALANVGLFFQINSPPLVPDFLLSLGVQLPSDIHKKRHRSYFLWEYGKPPEVVAEVVSNKEGAELTTKKIQYAQIGVPLYVVWDPELLISSTPLQVFSLHFRSYVPVEDRWFPEIGLGLTLWSGTFEKFEAQWLRWCDQQGQLILTGEERAEREYQRAEQEHQRAEQEFQRAERERTRADQAEKRAEELAAKLLKSGMELNG